MSAHRKGLSTKGCYCAAYRDRRETTKAYCAKNRENGLPIGDPRHGKTGYCNFGCKCDICRAGYRADYVARVKPRQKKRAGR